ncbi:MAG TPA: tRNA (adenine-N1)-methyltransferase [Thermoplasmata archaeon]|nr:tRNA (adenine-N1)-methyltransferase [Thermoplasmata archaeon]
MSAAPNDALREGEPVLLRRRAGDVHLTRLSSAPVTIEGVGVVDLAPVIGKPSGSAIDWAGRRSLVLRPTLSDLLGQLRRRAQIVTPKDAMFLLYLAGVGPGARVAEAGSGSGALTTVLAYAVGATGRVTSFDRREEFVKVARSNVEQAGLADRVEFRLRDVGSDGLDGGPYQSVVLDLAEPWTALPSARSALEIGGHVATYTPTYNQLERTVRALAESRFDEIRSVELLERALHVGEGGTRPEFDMLGHTGFLTGARRVE